MMSKTAFVVQNVDHSCLKSRALLPKLIEVFAFHLFSVVDSMPVEVLMSIFFTWTALFALSCAINVAINYNNKDNNTEDSRIKGTSV